MVGNIIKRLRSEVPEIHLSEVDITEHPETAIKYRILATPAIAINGKLEFMGVPQERALRDRLLAASKR